MSKSAEIGVECVIEVNVVVNSEAVVKDGVFICAGAVVNHNAVVEDFVQVDCNAVVSMRVEIPKGMKVESCTVFKKIEMAREFDNESFF